MPRKKKSMAETITLADHLRSIAGKGGEARALALTAKQRQKIAAKAAPLGGIARADKLTAKQRSDIAKAGAKARWGKKDSQ
jgi:hypothetical protein